MTEIAGEVCDGVFFHPFTTTRYLREVTIPALRRGQEAAGRGSAEVALCGAVLTAVGRDDAELATAITSVRGQIAFYASTPAYRPVLQLHGWEGLAEELTSLTKQNRWGDLAGLIDDEMLHTVAVVGTPADVARRLVERFGPIATSVSMSTPYDYDRTIGAEVGRSLADIQGGSSPT